MINIFFVFLAVFQLSFHNYILLPLLSFRFSLLLPLYFPISLVVMKHGRPRLKISPRYKIILPTLLLPKRDLLCFFFTRMHFLFRYLIYSPIPISPFWIYVFFALGVSTSLIDLQRQAAGTCTIRR